MAKAAFNKKRAPFTSTLDLELRKKLVKCCIPFPCRTLNGVAILEHVFHLQTQLCVCHVHF
jgi:hypothetical protein